MCLSLAMFTFALGYQAPVSGRLSPVSCMSSRDTDGVRQGGAAPTLPESTADLSQVSHDQDYSGLVRSGSCQ